MSTTAKKVNTKKGSKKDENTEQESVKVKGPVTVIEEPVKVEETVMVIEEPVKVEDVEQSLSEHDDASGSVEESSYIIEDYLQDMKTAIDALKKVSTYTFEDNGATKEQFKDYERYSKELAKHLSNYIIYNSKIVLRCKKDEVKNAAKPKKVRAPRKPVDPEKGSFTKARVWKDHVYKFMDIKKEDANHVCFLDVQREINSYVADLKKKYPLEDKSRFLVKDKMLEFFEAMKKENLIDSVPESCTHKELTALTWLNDTTIKSK